MFKSVWSVGASSTCSCMSFNISFYCQALESSLFRAFVPFNSDWYLTWTPGTRGAHCYWDIIVLMSFQRRKRNQKLGNMCVGYVCLYVCLYVFIPLLSLYWYIQFQSSTIRLILGLLPFMCNTLLPEWETWLLLYYLQHNYLLHFF